MLVGGDQALDRHVGVDLSRRERGVPEQFLDAPQVCSPFEQVRRSRMPQPVRAGIRRDA